MPQARYQIHVPSHHREGHAMPMGLDAVRRALTAAGLKSRVVLNPAEADLGDDTPQKMAIVIVDGEDDPQTDNAIKAVAEGFKGISSHEAVYITKSPITTWLV